MLGRLGEDLRCSVTTITKVIYRLAFLGRFANPSLEDERAMYPANPRGKEGDRRYHRAVRRIEFNEYWRSEKVERGCRLVKNVKKRMKKIQSVQSGLMPALQRKRRAPNF